MQSFHYAKIQSNCTFCWSFHANINLDDHITFDMESVDNNNDDKVVNCCVWCNEHGSWLVIIVHCRPLVVVWARREVWYGEEGGVHVKMTPSMPSPPCVLWTPCGPGMASDRSAASRIPHSSTHLVPSSPGRLDYMPIRKALLPWRAAVEGVGETPFPPRLA